MIAFFKRMFYIDHMVKPEELLGDLPTTKLAYQRAMKMAWPSIVESVLTSLIGSIDMMMVGTLGTAAIASVGLTTQPRFILLCVIFSLNVGVTAVIARRKGENDMLSANKTLKQMLVFCIIISSILAVLGYCFAEELVVFAGAKADTVKEATTYFQIICTGLVFNAISLTINAAQRGAGNTIISMTTNVTANIINVIFNYLLINGNMGFPALGIAGAAIATNIGLFVSCIMSIRSVLNKYAFISLRNEGRWLFDKETVGSVYKISSSSFIEQIFFRIGFFINARIVAELGTMAFATYQVGMQVINLSFTFGDGLAVAGSALVGQQLGKKRPDMAVVYASVLQRLSFVISSFLFVLFITCRYQIFMLFDRSPEVIANGSIIMIIIAFTTHIQTSQVVITGCLRGAGDTKFVAKTSMISTAIIRPLTTYVLCFPMGFEVFGSWYALFIDQSLRLSMNFIRFVSRKWQNIKI